MTLNEHSGDPFAKDPKVRLEEINEELHQIQDRIQVLEAQKNVIIQGLHDKIGDTGTQDILEKVWEQKQTEKK